MLSNQHFYHRIIRKVVVGFGNLFNNIKLYRYAIDGITEIERITVPLSYAAKEKFYTRITQDPTLGKELAITVPRMGFEMTSVIYDPLRKTSAFNPQFFPNPNGNLVDTMVISPYNFNFDLFIYVRNTEDGTQIVEQILPFFSPDYTLTLDMSSLLDLKLDMPIVLNSVNYEQNYIGESDQLRSLIWSLNFTVKGYMFGPVSSNTKIIRKATANTYNDFSMQTGDRVLILGAGSGDYKTGELVYEGRRPPASNATGFVQNWSNVTNKLTLTDTTGVFESSRRVFGAVSNTSYIISAYERPNQQMVNLEVTPDPPNANANTAFGFIETVQEYPDII